MVAALYEGDEPGLAELIYRVVIEKGTFRVPCLTLRENTERPVTVTQGTNTVVGCEPARIVTKALAILDSKSRAGCVPELWDGRAAERILNVLEGMVE